MRRPIQKVVTENLTPDDWREIAAADPVDASVDVWYSYSIVNPGFCAAVAGAPGEGLVAKTRGHASAIEAVRAIASQVAA